MTDNLDPSAAAAALSTPAPSEVSVARELADFISGCPSMFHTVSSIRARLDEAGFAYLPESAPWEAVPGSRCYTVRNNSSVIAFKVGEGVDLSTPEGRDRLHFQLTAAHTDSPTFKVKANAELSAPGGARRLNVEVYGGAIDYTWFDRPLSVAGRAMVRTADGIESRLVAIDRDVALIPSVPIHLDHGVNAKFSPNRQVDLCPLFSAGSAPEGAFDALVAADLGVAPEDVLARDLFLWNRQRPEVWGAESEFISAPKLDDLGCAFASLKAFLAADNPACVTAFCCFDNEEVGSNTKQGAMSTFLADSLARLSSALGATSDDLRRAISRSMLVSCDNAHAVHPNHPEKYDEGNRVFLNRGIVVKEAANQKYCTDAFSRAVFQGICDRAGVPWRSFANRSDMTGGSTLGNLSNIQVSMHAVDVGLPQLAMHSSYETAGTRDVALGIAALEAFFRADIRIDGAVAARF